MAADPVQRQGLYDPQHEHDSCGVSFVCDIGGEASHDVVSLGVRALCNLEHRGALGADPLTGDGAGILIQIPDRFLRDVVDYELPPAGHYATGIGFLPPNRAEAQRAAVHVEEIVRSEGLHLLGWREVPIEPSMLGRGSLAAMPSFRQVFIGGDGLSGIDLDRRAYIVRKRIEHEIGPGGAGYRAAEDVEEAMGSAAPPHAGVYFASLSARTIVYKGMLMSRQLTSFYVDLRDERVGSALALVHSRFSTNTFPSWPLAHPYRMIAHNGEINTIRGNRNWMHARETLLSSPHLEGLERALPICTPDASDTAGFDEVLELLTLSGYSMAEAVLMMIPEPWEHHAEMSGERKAFYQYHATRMEPWDGPASIAFTDGTVIGAVLDRNGLRPSRYLVTNDGLVVMASETGVIDIPQSSVVEKGRLQPGRMFLIDTAEGRIVRDDEIKDRLAAARPYGRWLDKNLVHLDDLPRREAQRRDEGSLIQRQADVRAHPRGASAAARAHGHRRQGGARLDGHRHPSRGAVGPQPAHLRLLQAAVRAGDQPAPRRHTRGARHLPVRPGRPRGQPVRPAAVVVPDRAPRPAGRHRRGAGPPGARRRPRRARRLPRRGAGGPVPGGRGRRGPAAGAGGAAGGGVGGHRGRRQHPDRVGPGRRRAHGPRSRRCWPCRRSTSTWWSSAPAPGWAWCRSPATPARCTTCACTSATAPTRSTPTWLWRPSPSWSPRASTAWRSRWASRPRSAATSRLPAPGSSR